MSTSPPVPIGPTPCDPSRRDPLTLHGALDLIAAATPDQRIAFPDEDEVLTSTDLATTSHAVAAALAAHGVRPGDRVGILSPNAPEFLTSLFGIVRAGAAAAPLALPLGTDLADYVTRLARIVGTAELSHLVVSHRIVDRIGPALAALAGPAVLDSAVLDSAVLDSSVPGTPAPTVAVGDAAIVQFTSGSTSDPKGVVLRHANVWHCARSITEAIRLDADDVHGSWLPLFHDMGLFGALTGLFRGIPLHLWSPAGFVRRPARWLSRFAQVGATISTMPNFGYDTLLNAVGPSEAAALDLSRWRVAFNGAEAVSATAVDAFLGRFAPAGFRPSAMVPAYGMAEVTLVATLPPSGRAPVVEHVDRGVLAAEGLARPVEAGSPDARPLVGLGRAVPGMSVRVAGDDGAGCPDGIVGEIQMRGPMTTTGYLGGRDDPFTSDGWLHSGDLGYLRDGELFFTGRRKEMITVAGRNVYPGDVEDAARGVDGVHKGRCVAFAETPDDGAPGGSERVVVVVETSPGSDDDTREGRRDALARRVRERVAATVGTFPRVVHAVAPRTIPRTTSGKMRRLDMRGRLQDRHEVNS